MQAPSAGAAAGGPAGEGVDGDRARRSEFRSRTTFVHGARGAYELIVNAFAKGDRETLRGLLTPRVYNSYVAAIDAREAKGEAGPELVRLKIG